MWSGPQARANGMWTATSTSIISADTAQAAKGAHYGACHALEVEWAELVQRLIPSAQRVRFTVTGTEATHLALRVADIGDVPINPYNLADSMRIITERYTEVLTAGCKPLTLGGDHTVCRAVRT